MVIPDNKNADKSDGDMRHNGNRQEISEVPVQQRKRMLKVAAYMDDTP